MTVSLIIMTLNEIDGMKKLMPKINPDWVDEIILVGSGKGVISINKILGENWRRKSLKYYRILSDYYKKAVTKCPTYYS